MQACLSACSGGRSHVTTHDPGPSPSPPIHMEIPWTYSNLFTFGTPQTPAPLDLDIYWQAGDCYHPQTKFAKVMFSQVSVCPRGVSAPLHAGIHPPGQTTPGQTPPGQTTPMGRHPPGKTHPPLHSACWDTGNKQVVRIPLECILVFFSFH